MTTPRKPKTDINELEFDDLEGTVEVARHLFQRKKLTHDMARSLIMGVNDKDELGRRLEAEGIKVNADSVGSGRRGP